jgi:hypothetical protein
VQGSVFVEFSDFSSVEVFLKADPKPSWNGEDLLIMTKYVLHIHLSRRGDLGVGTERNIVRRKLRRRV